MSCKIIVYGWLPDGRPIQVERLSEGDNKADISQLYAIGRDLDNAGILAREPQADEMEKSETVHYVPRSISENEIGESPKIYLYTERFQFKFFICI